MDLASDFCYNNPHMTIHYFTTDTTLPCTVELSDAKAMRNLFLRLKRILLRYGSAQSILETVVENWEENYSIRFDVPMPVTTWRVKFTVSGLRRVSLHINSSTVSVRLDVIESPSSGYRIAMLGDLFYANLVKLETTPFSDEDIIAEVMEFLYDYSDYEIMEDAL